MICDNCGQNKARRKRTSRAYGKGRNMLVIDDVPIVVCSGCGESYMTAETLREIERLKLHRKSLKSKRQAPVIAFV